MTIKITSKVYRKGLAMGVARPAVGLVLRVGDGATLYKTPLAPTPKATSNRAQRRAAIAAGKARP